jgi:signal transduction histidine kinase
VLNLVNNAILHSMTKKTIVVGLRRTKGMAEISVQDYGQGIPDEELATIFDRFRQGSGVHAGLGLGLYIAREIVSGHGGAITASSRPGEGATFTVTLPLVNHSEKTSKSKSKN